MDRMDSLIGFLRARLDEDERIALADLNETWKPEIGEDGNVIGFAAPMQSLSTARGLHIARHDPARVLREVDAKRQIAEQHDRFPQPQMMATGQIWACSTCGSVDDSPTEWPCATLRLLALPYADHPDYDDEWRP